MVVNETIISSIKIIIQTPQQKKNIKQEGHNKDSNQVVGNKKGVNSKISNSLHNNNHKQVLLLKSSLQLAPIPLKKCNYATLNARKIKKRKKQQPPQRQQKITPQSLNLKKTKQNCQRTQKNQRKVTRWNYHHPFPCQASHLARRKKPKARTYPPHQL